MNRNGHSTFEESAGNTPIAWKPPRRNLTKFDDTVAKSYQTHKIGGAAAQTLRTASSAFGKVAACGP